MRRVFIIRHAESMANLDLNAYAQGDPNKIELSEWGYTQQARVTGHCIRQLYEERKDLAGHKLRIICDKSTRSLQSRQAFMEGFLYGPHPDYTLVEDDALRERDYGDLTGVPDKKEWEKRYPDIWAKLNSPDKYVRYTTKMPGATGESLEDVVIRARNFCLDKLGLRTDDQLCDAHERVAAYQAKIDSGEIKDPPRQLEPNEDVVIITHGRVCRALEKVLVPRNAGWYVEAPSPNNGSVMEVQVGRGLRQGFGVTSFKGLERLKNLPADYMVEPWSVVEAKKKTARTAANIATGALPPGTGNGTMIF